MDMIGLKEFGISLWMLFNEMSPYLLLGFFIAGVLHVVVPKGFYGRHLAKERFSSVVWSTLIGIPLPLCSCGVIPTAVSLRREGASKGATSAFLVATPQTGVDSIIASYSVLGLPFAIIRPIAALLTALFAGAWISYSEKGASQPVSRTESAPASTNLWQKIKEAYQYSFVEMMQDVGKWLVIGLFLAGAITAFVPSGFFSQFQQWPLLNLLLILVISIPMYICATGSIPIAAALMLKGLSPGAAFVLLMAGPATNVASILVLEKTLGRRTTLIYLSSIILGAIVFGLVIDYALPSSWFVLPETLQQVCCHDDIQLFGFSSFCSLLFLILFVSALMRKHTHSHSHGEAASASTVCYNVSGMNCNHCKASVEKAVADVEGVAHVTADVAKKCVFVEGTPNEQLLAKAIEEAGFKYQGKREEEQS